MTIATNTFLTYSAVGNREDITDKITMISPTDTPFMSGIRSETATAKLHEWQTVSLASASVSNAQIEGDDTPAADSATITARVGNRTQISRKIAQVSGTQEAVNHAGRKSELAYQVALKGMELRRDIETILLNNQAKVTGDSTTASKLQGLEPWLITNYDKASDGSNGNGSTVNTDGTARAFTESQFKSVLKQCYDSGGKPDTLMVGSFNKQVASTFSGNSTKVKVVGDSTLDANVDIYVSDFGTIKIVPNRFVRYGGTQSVAFVLEMDKFGIAYLPGRSFMAETLAKTGDSTKKQITCEYTLVVDNQASSGRIADLTIA